MSRFEEIRSCFPDAAGVLKQAGLTSDSDLRTLDSADLQELFPGPQNRQKRHFLKQSAGATSRTGSEAIMRKIREVRSDAASVLENEDPPVDLCLLDRTDLQELFPEVEKLKWRKEIYDIIQSPKTSSPFKTSSGLYKSEVKYQILKSGNPLDVYHQVIKKVSRKSRVRFVEASGDHKVSILFCPVISRIGSDAETAIATIKDDKPVILVFLIHSLKAQSLTLLKSWDHPNIVLHAHLFHHQMKSGLLSCKENKTAISAIKKKLKEYSVPI
eukprot:XP_011619022.1 PREDICTED: uncharacterized protein LOC105419260 isoform X3 [Takifugu rubripes]